MRGMVFSSLLLGTLVLAACGGGGGGGSSSSDSGGSAASNAASSTSGSNTSAGSTSSSGSTTSTTACTGSFMGKTSLLIGAQMEDSTAAAAPYDVRYRYLAGGIRAANSCANSCDGSCGQWWGCWQDTSKAPGQYVLSHLSSTAAATWNGVSRPQIAAITYYELLTSSGTSEGASEVAAINDASFLKRYFDDWRFLLQTIGSKQALLHIEPDFWGFVRQVSSNPASVPAAVTTANATDCAGQANNASGFAKCMIAMVRKYAPNAKVGLHASPWNYTQSGDAAAVGTFMSALGAGDGDFVVTDPSDRDAGYYDSLGQNRWWTDSSAAAYLAWSKTLAQKVGRPTIMWQIPLGNSAQTNTANHWKDNRVEWLFAHLSDVSQASVVALLFGAGQSDQTEPETDGGLLSSKTISYRSGSGTALCQ